MVTTLKNPKMLVIATLSLVASFFLFGTSKAEAATIPVTGSCTIAQAINSVNAGSNQGTCVGSGAYGTNDTINIPAGTFLLTSDAVLTNPVTIQGAGMNQTIVDGDGLYNGFTTEEDLTIKDLKIIGFDFAAINAKSSSVILDKVEVDGSDAVPSTYGNPMFGIRIQGPDAGGASSVVANHVYVHSITATNTESYAFGFIVELGGTVPGAAMSVNLTNTTVSDLESVTAGVHSLLLTAGLYASSAGGSITANVANTTINNISAAEFATGFGTFAMASSGVSLDLHTVVRNATVTGLAGNPSVYVDKSPAFFSAGAATPGGVVTVIEEVKNSLLANNNTNGISSNCFAGDLSAPFEAGGGVVNASIISEGHNLSDDASCTSFTEDGDQQNVGNILSTLGPLQMNGGAVPTRALLPGSPAISAGGAVLGVTTDARGVARPFANPSVGAYQYVLGDETENPAGGNAQNGAGQLSETGQGYALIALAILIVSAGAAVVIRRQRA